MTLNLDPPNRAHFLRGNLTKGLLYSRIGQLLRMVEVRNKELREVANWFEIAKHQRQRIKALEADIADLQTRLISFSATVKPKEGGAQRNPTLF